MKTGQKSILKNEFGSELGSDRIGILGVGVDSFRKSELARILNGFLRDKKQHFLATVNAEFVIEAQTNDRFLRILNFSDLNLADGIGVLWAAKYLSLKINDNFSRSRKWRIYRYKMIALFQAFYSLSAVALFPKFIKSVIPERVTGSSLVNLLMDLTKEGNFSVYLLGGGKGVAQRAQLELERKYPKGLVVGSRGGFVKKGSKEKLFEAVNKAQPDILLVGLGSPKQEEWIFKNMDRMPSVKVAVGIGGVLDFLAHTKKRAPRWMRERGLEWLFRLIKEPARLPRIKNATFKFIKEVVRFKMNSWQL
jgi:N-acetylglucosaminyldiphosphoundecaprenol N-acetyl-beta-D-mannosaminyltransferase